MRVKVGALALMGIAAFAVPAVALENGGPGDDAIRGTKGADDIAGRGGNDVLSGRGGKDRIRGAGGEDHLKGGRGKDRLLGGGRSDVLVGGKGRDTLNPGKGEDGVNVVDGAEVPSPGRDVIRARDGSPDEISCGDGNDKAFVDAEEDGVFDCETVVEPPVGQP